MARRCGRRSARGWSRSSFRRCSRPQIPTCAPWVAVLAGAGLRVGEAVALDWADANLATGTLTVGRAKTDAGSFREVDMPGGLIETLSE